MISTPDCQSSRHSQIGRLLEAAARKGYTDEVEQRKEEALVHTLLSICTRKSPAEWSCNVDLGLGWSGEGDLTIPLVNICANSTGVVQSLALQALKTWCDDHNNSIDQCIQLGAVPMLLSIMSSSLPEAAPGTPAAYTASMAVILLKAIVRNDPQQGGEAFLAARGLDTLFNLMSHPSLDAKSLCLVLYLINDITRRSIDILDQSINSDAVPRIVSILKQPVSEATKFAALILNRWSLAAQHVPTIRAAGSIDALFNVLINSYETSIDIDTETVAYALSAISIMSQDAIPDIRSRLLSCKTSMAAVSRAIAHYEGAFQGVGFPHAMLCMLLDGSEGAEVIAALAAWGLLSSWLSARHVSSVLVERAAQPDVDKALERLTNHDEALEASIAITHLAQHSPRFLPSVMATGHLERLTTGALTEFVLKSTQSFEMSMTDNENNNDTIVTETTSVVPLVQQQQLPITTTTTTTTTSTEQQETDIDCLHSNSNNKSIPSCMDMTTAAADPCIEDPRPQLPMLLPSPSRSSSATAITMIETLQSTGSMSLMTEEPSRCTAALASLASMTSDDNNDDIVDDDVMIAYGSSCEFNTTTAIVDDDDDKNATMMTVDDDDTIITTNPRASKRPRLANNNNNNNQSSHSIFSRSDVNVRRYDTLCFNVGGHDVHAVGFVLEAHSPFLRGLLSTLDNVNQSIVIPNVNPFSGETMHTLFVRAVEWCYTGTVEGLEDHEDAFNLWILAEFLQIDGLQRYCEAVLARWFVHSPDVLHRCLNLADRYPSAVPMRRLAARYVLSFIVVLERCQSIVKDTVEKKVSMEVESAMAMLIAAHASTLAVEMAEVMRARLRGKVMDA